MHVFIKNYYLDCRPPIVLLSPDTVLLCANHIFHFTLFHGGPRAADSATTAVLYADLLTREMQLPIYDVEKEYLYTTILVRKRFV